jgi:maltose O-acetyltransferase
MTRTNISVVVHLPAERERMLAGEPYHAMAPDLLAERAACRAAVERYNATPSADPDALSGQLSELLGSVGEGVVIVAPLHCDYGRQISVGDHSFANFGLIVLDEAPVSIGAHVLIGPGVQLITATHPLEAARRRTGEETAAPIWIGDDVWLAAGVIVLPGVRIGAGTVVGAGSVVTGDLPPGQLCYGNPCRVIRAL